ncbi:hypothetical protein CU669_16995 [Paramagnetospirillum kuznetsovii]|uniref:Response regulatory domain-containing protein n=1 Tax=Paramagnetospirillum kuznetsovii TaxID=2053833 RepID=A0A364NV45_9PROT|nr:response regulator [Paramagnetospirillum kuznetsovii]RAU20775.1 hypothetical protein CU669_16995 [Paramagnetospirillum kuznetsovii]
MTSKVERAVIIEDCPEMRGLIHMALGSCGAKEIIEVGNGAEAIAVLKVKGADIAIMDWKMEVMDGFECTRLIRAGIEGIDPVLPIVLLTAQRGPDNEADAYAIGVDHYMEKPFSLRQLNEGLVIALSRPHIGRKRAYGSDATAT